MKLVKSIFSLQNNENNDSCTNIWVYELSSSDEYFKLSDMTHEELLEELGLYEDRSIGRPFGQIFHEYDFVVKPDCLIIIDNEIMNV